MCTVLSESWLEQHVNLARSNRSDWDLRFKLNETLLLTLCPMTTHPSGPCSKLVCQSLSSVSASPRVCMITTAGLALTARLSSPQDLTVGQAEAFTVSTCRHEKPPHCGPRLPLTPIARVLYHFTGCFAVMRVTR